MRNEEKLESRVGAKVRAPSMSRNSFKMLHQQESHVRNLPPTLTTRSGDARINNNQLDQVHLLTRRARPTGTDHYS